jgi:hypothetical protein
MIHNIVYTQSSLVDIIKKQLATVLLDQESYIQEIQKYKKNRQSNQYNYDYKLELDFSDNPKIPFAIDGRWYYYKAFQFQKLGLFKREDVPTFKVQLSHLTNEIIYALTQLDIETCKFVLKQAVSRIFEDINFDLYHDSISDRLEVILVR